MAQSAIWAVETGFMESECHTQERSWHFVHKEHSCLVVWANHHQHRFTAMSGCRCLLISSIRSDEVS